MYSGMASPFLTKSNGGLDAETTTTSDEIFLIIESYTTSACTSSKTKLWFTSLMTGFKEQKNLKHFNYKKFTKKLVVMKNNILEQINLHEKRKRY